MCFWEGFGANAGLVAVDEHGRMFSFVAAVTLGQATAEGCFGTFAAGFWVLAMLMWDWSGQL